MSGNPAFGNLRAFRFDSCLKRAGEAQLPDCAKRYVGAGATLVSNYYTLMSGKRGSNSRPSAWEADALPTELLPLLLAVAFAKASFAFMLR